MKKFAYISIILLLIFFTWYTQVKVNNMARAATARRAAKTQKPEKPMPPKNFKYLYLAGGCFWGTQAFLDEIPGVESTQAGYANGNVANPSYEQVREGNTGYAETVRLQYDPLELPLEKLVTAYFDTIDPTSVNRQGGDAGSQYRTGIYYTDPNDVPVIQKVFDEVQSEYKKPLAVELRHLRNFYPAEEYHQKYLEKNPGGYCHVDLKLADKYK